MIGDISMVRALGIRRIPVAVATSDRAAKSLRSKYCRAAVKTQSLYGRPEAVVDGLVEWGARQAERPVLFYQGDRDLLIVSRFRERLSQFFSFVLPSKRLVEDLADKSRFCEVAKREALPVPDTLVIRAENRLADTLAKWDSFPCVLKPASRSPRWSRIVGGNQKALHVENRRALGKVLLAIDADETPLLLQASIEGGEENVLSYHAYVRDDGEIAAEFTGRKIRTSPRQYGLSTYLEITDDAQVRRLGREIVRKLGFNGVLKIDLKRDARSERLYVLEINPRFNLWHHPGTVAGVAIPELVYWDCVGKSKPRAVEPVRPGVRWIVPLSDKRALCEYRAVGQATRLRWIYEVVTADVNEGFAISDPWPAIVTVAEMLRRKLLGTGSVTTDAV